MIPGKQVLLKTNYKILCKKKGENGFSYWFNLNVSLSFTAPIKKNIFMVLSLGKSFF